MLKFDTRLSRSWLVAALCLQLAAPTMSIAKSIDMNAVRASTRTWVSRVATRARPNASIKQMEAFVKGSDTLAYIVHLQDGGFCLAGADDMVLPVYLYVTGGDFDPTDPNYQAVLDEISQRTLFMRRQQDAGDSSFTRFEAEIAVRREAWHNLASGKPSLPQSTALLEGIPSEFTLPVTTKWNQHYPFNVYCPTGYQRNKTVVGCVATAGSQLMKYWNWPKSGLRSHSYSWNGDNSCDGQTPGLTLSATFSDSYEWELMPDECWGGYSIEQIQALAELCFEVGVAIEMDYGVCGSSAYMSDLRNALVSYFRYDGDAKRMDRNSNGFNIIAEELCWLRPVIFRGQSEVGGHAWVIYGYKSATSELLMNMGNSYSSYPDWEWWYTFDSCPYPDGQMMIMQLAPKDVVKFVGANDAGDGSPGDPYGDIQEASIEAPAGCTLIFKTGSTNTFSVSSVLLAKPMTLKGKNIVIRHQ